MGATYPLTPFLKEGGTGTPPCLVLKKKTEMTFFSSL